MNADIRDRIAELKRQRRAIILAHNYQRPEVQDIADFVGDSLGLAQAASRTDSEVIVFCGVHFMAETAAIICPAKTVLFPDPNAGCPMADMVTPRELAAYKANHPQAKVVMYVNSSAAVKAMSDICCTSANAAAVVRTLPADAEILFAPDRNLGHYVSRLLNRRLDLWPGYCPTHERILPEHVQQMRAAHPEAVLVVHPECRPEVVKMADAVASTSGILEYCRRSDKKEFIIGTELGLLHRLRKNNPGKTFYRASPVSDCPNMKLISLEKILWALEDMAPVVTVNDPIASQARQAIDRMLAVVPPTAK